MCYESVGVASRTMGSLLTATTIGESPAHGPKLPVANLLEYPDLKRAILQRVDRTPEQHFCSLIFSEFVTQLAEGMAEWVQCHRLVFLEEAIRLAKDHVTALPGAGKGLPVLLPALLLSLNHGNRGNSLKTRSLPVFPHLFLLLQCLH